MRWCRLCWVERHQVASDHNRPLIIICATFCLIVEPLPSAAVKCITFHPSSTHCYLCQFPDMKPDTYHIKLNSQKICLTFPRADSVFPTLLVIWDTQVVDRAGSYLPASRSSSSWGSRYEGYRHRDTYSLTSRKNVVASGNPCLDLHMVTLRWWNSIPKE